MLLVRLIIKVAYKLKKRQENVPRLKDQPERSHTKTVDDVNSNTEQFFLCAIMPVSSSFKHQSYSDLVTMNK